MHTHIRTHTRHILITALIDLQREIRAPRGVAVYLLEADRSSIKGVIIVETTKEILKNHTVPYHWLITIPVVKKVCLEWLRVRHLR